MSTSDNRKTAVKLTLIYIAVSAFCALFGAVYECFSHGVYSFFMIYAFAFPLGLGALPFGIAAVIDRPLPTPLTRYIYHSAVATATVGSMFEGVLEIYGTTNRLVYIYLLGAVVLLVIAFARLAIELLTVPPKT